MSGFFVVQELVPGTNRFGRIPSGKYPCMFMNSDFPSPDLRELHGRTVLLSSARDRRHPSTALRGTLEVATAPGGEPLVTLVWEIPDMFNAAAHRRTVVLDQVGLRRLLASESNGTYEFTLDQALD